MYMEFKRKELEDQDAMRDSQRKMAWFALGGMLLYPFAVVVASLADLDNAQKTLGDMRQHILLQLLVLLPPSLELRHSRRNDLL